MEEVVEKCCPLYRSIYEDLLRRLSRGEMQAGDKLPTIPQLCEIYNAGASSVRRALAMLQKENYIRTEARNGTIITYDASLNEKPVAAVMPVGCPGDWETFNTLVLPSVMISSMSAAGVRAATPQQLRTLRQRLAVSMRMDGDLPMGERIRGFFKDMVSLAGNPMLDNIFEDLTNRFVVFSSSDKMREPALRRLKQAYSMYFMAMDRILERGELDKLPETIRDFYVSIYRIPNSFAFSVTHREIAALRNQPLYYQLLQNLLGQILSGNLQKGDYLPTEEQLGEEWNVSRFTVRKTYGALKEMGLVSARPRHGTKVVVDGSGKFLRQQMRDASKQTMMAFDAISVIFPEICALGMDRMPDDTLARMRVQLEEQTRNFSQKGVPLLLVNQLLTPVVLGLRSERLHQYYLYLIAPLVRYAPLRPNCIADLEVRGREAYRLGLRALDDLEAYDAASYANAVDAACALDRGVYSAVYHTTDVAS